MIATCRPNRLAGLVGLAAVAAMALTSCGAELQPGTAASIGDTRIAQADVDDLVVAACAFSAADREAQGSGEGPTASIAFLRTTITQQLIQTELSEMVAAERGLTVNDSTVTALAAGSELPAGMDDDDAELIGDFFEDRARSLLQQAVIGANERDESVTVADESLTQQDVDAAQEVLAEAAADEGVEVNPAYGSWDGSAVVPSSGSLSDPVSETARAAFEGLSGDAAALADLPASQVCG